MKTIIAVTLGGVLLMALFLQWRDYRAVAAPSARASQIYIHGTPVCVFEERGGIVARVGECDAAEDGSGESPEGRVPFHGFHGGRGLNLPPGHPPVGDEMLPEGGGKRTLI